MPFPNIALSTPAPVVFTAELTNVDPAETNAADDSAAATVDVTDFELAPSRLVVRHLGGFGTQFNQHVYANITPTPPGSLPALEDKVNALEPQFVRIFYNDQAERAVPRPHGVVHRDGRRWRTRPARRSTSPTRRL